MPTARMASDATARIEGETDSMVDKGQALELAHDVRQLHAVALEEPAPRRHVVEDVLDHHCGAYGTDARLLTDDLGTVDEQVCAGGFLFDGGAELYLCDGAYAG